MEGAARLDFSVVIPLYNKSDSVGACVASVLSQTHPPLEIIIVDDGSTDGSLEIALAVDDPRVRVLRREEPGPGGYAARNLGVVEAKGAWIAFIDADDLWLPHHLESLAAAVSRNPGVGGAFSRFYCTWSDRKTPYPIASIFAIDRPVNLNDFLQAWLKARDCPLWTGAVAFERRRIVEAGLFPAGKALRGGDKDLWLRIVSTTTLAFSPEFTAEFRQDAVDRLSHRTPHTSLPIVARTASILRKTQGQATRRLLARLINREIGRYAKRNTRDGISIPTTFYHSLQWPGSLTMGAYMLALSVMRPLFSPPRDKAKGALYLRTLRLRNGRSE